MPCLSLPIERTYHVPFSPDARRRAVFRTAVWMDANERKKKKHTQNNFPHTLKHIV